jgi:putative salt-induced outer membrane protein
MNKSLTLLWSALISTTSIGSTLAQENTATWHGQGEAGFVKASGNTDSENLNIGLNFKNAGPLWTHDIKLSAYQASTDDTNTANNLSADYTLKRELTERSNLFFALGYLDDDFDGFTEQYSTSIGYGYKLIDREPQKWETGIGLGYRDASTVVRLSDGDEIEDKDVSGATLVLRSDYIHKLTDNTEFVDKFKAEIGSDNSFIENDAALYVAMNDRFSLKASIIVRHNTDPAEGNDDTDTISSLSLVYKFGH